MKRNIELLSTMSMAISGRVGNNSISNKWLIRVLGIRKNTGSPRAVEYLLHLLPLLESITDIKTRHNSSMLHYKL